MSPNKTIALMNFFIEIVVSIGNIEGYFILNRSLLYIESIASLLTCPRLPEFPLRRLRSNFRQLPPELRC